MKKSRNLLSTTTNSRVYKSAKKIQDCVGCDRCRPHRGCNGWWKYPKRNWKQYRNTQYKL